jgi:hypothetical protein
VILHKLDLQPTVIVVVVMVVLEVVVVVRAGRRHQVLRCPDGHHRTRDTGRRRRLRQQPTVVPGRVTVLLVLLGVPDGNVVHMVAIDHVACFPAVQIVHSSTTLRDCEYSLTPNCLPSPFSRTSKQFLSDSSPTQLGRYDYSFNDVDTPDGFTRTRCEGEKKKKYKRRAEGLEQRSVKDTVCTPMFTITSRRPWKEAEDHVFFVQFYYTSTTHVRSCTLEKKDEVSNCHKAIA